MTNQQPPAQQPDRYARGRALDAALQHTRNVADHHYVEAPTLAELLDIADVIAGWIDTGQRP